MAYLKQNRPDSIVRTACRNGYNLRMVLAANMKLWTPYVKDYLKKFVLTAVSYALYFEAFSL